MNSLMIFENQQVEVLNFNGQALFNPYNVGKCLDIDDVTVRRHIQSMNTKQVIKLKNSIVQNMNFRKLHNTGENFLTKSGVYKLIFKSHKPEAERFQDWVTDEVLPQIEQTGGYIPVSADDDEKTILSKAVIIANKTIEQKDRYIAQLEPQAQAFRDLMTAQGYLQMIDVCGMVNKGRNSLFQFLREQKVLTKQSIFNVPYERFRKNGMFKVITSKDDKGHFTTVTMVSPKGLVYIYKLLKKYDMLNEFNSTLLLELQEMEVSA